MRRTMLSAFQKLKAFMASAMKKAMTMPDWPPMSAPMPTKMAVMTASRIPVLSKLNDMGADPSSGSARLERL